jgi:transcriptional regulator with XRE-family HTH domain
MRGEQLKQGRLAATLTQVEAAERLGLSQPYLSQLETGSRAVTPGVARAAAKLYRLPPTSLTPPPEPPETRDASERLPRQLAALGYPGYSHLRKSPLANPAVVVLEALSEESLDGRVTEALPWVLEQYPELDWKWLVANAKLRNVQNRLGFLVTVALKLAERRLNKPAVEKLNRVEDELESARLAAETTLGREAMPPAEREWLREHRSPEARHWNVLAGLKLQELPYAR